jgi:hypothetical protein
MAKRKAKGPKTLWDKVHDVDPSFATSVNTMTEKELREAVVEIDSQDERILKAKEDDFDLKRVREELSEANKSYSEPLKRNALKRKLAITTLQDRGNLPV